MSIKEIPRIASAVIIGSLLYVGMILIPFIGPLIAGLVTGKIAKGNTKRDFLIGIASGILGFLFLIFILFPMWDLKLNFFLWWIFIIWNLIAILLTGIGAVIGSMVSTTKEFFSGFNGFRKGRKKNVYIHEPNATVFVICPNCGTSNQENVDHCISCGMPLKR